MRGRATEPCLETGCLPHSVVPLAGRDELHALPDVPSAGRSSCSSLPGERLRRKCAGKCQPNAPRSAARRLSAEAASGISRKEGPPTCHTVAWLQACMLPIVVWGRQPAIPLDIAARRGNTPVSCHSNTKRLVEAERTPGRRVGCRPGSMGRRPPAGTHSHKGRHKGSHRHRVSSIPPVWPPERPDADPNSKPWASPPPVAPMPPAFVASMPALPRLPQSRAAQEQGC
jgi:hypothetical protein